MRQLRLNVEMVAKNSCQPPASKRTMLPVMFNQIYLFTLRNVTSQFDLLDEMRDAIEFVYERMGNLKQQQ